jgi:hypothetical protein
MAIPNISISVQNGGLGVSADKADGIQAIVGRISSGEFVDRSGSAIASASQIAVNTPTQFGTLDALIASCGTGIVAQAAALILATGHNVIICRAADNANASGTSGQPGYVAAVTFDTAVSDAVDALKASNLTFELVHICCDKTTDATPTVPTIPLTASQVDTLTTALDLKGAAFFAAHHYDGAFFVLEMEDPSGTFSLSSTSDYVAVCRGFVKSVNPISGAAQLNPLAWHTCQRCSQVELGRDLAATADGPLTGVSALTHDETADAGACDSLGVTTARTFPRHAGVYLTNARIRGGSSSDFQYWQHRRVMNAACAAAYDYLFTLLSDSVQVDTATGHIVESAAKAIEANTESAVKERVGAFVSGVTATVDRTTNILSTGTIPLTIAIVPLGYIKAITVKIGFENPALAQS